MTSPIIFIDVETTGLSPDRDRMTELALLFSDGKTITGRKSFLFNPECRIPEMITNLTGITQQLVDGAPKFHEQAREIVELTEGALLIGHNVRFDYAFLVAEFRSLGFRFQREHLCTLSLARRYFAGMGSYGLKRLCDKLGIVRPDLRAHRAEADAEMSFELFKRIYEASAATHLDELLNVRREPRHVPQLMTAEDIEALPRACGVYYFYDESDALIYVGKSINIHERVISHFRADLRDDKERRMKERVARISFKTTPTELAALLLEAEEIKRLKPIYNRMLRENRQNTGLYLVGDAEREPLRFCLRAHDSSAPDTPLKIFKTRGAAERYLAALSAEHKFCEHLNFRTERAFQLRFLKPCFGRQIDRCNGVCAGEESFAEYNRRVMAWVDFERGLEPESYLLCEKVKDAHLIVWIDRGIYRGWGLHRGRLSTRNCAQAVKSIEPKSDNPDVYRILRLYRLQDLKLKIYPLAASSQTSLYEAS